MKEVLNDLEVTAWGRWTDPGDYPSAAGSGPLPPGPPYPEDTDGCVIFAMNQQDWKDYEESKKEGCEDEMFDIGLSGVDDPPKVTKLFYHKFEDFLIVVPEFEDCGSPIFEKERDSSLAWLNKHETIWLTAMEKGALAELAISSPDRNFGVLSDLIPLWDDPNAQAESVTLPRTVWGRLYAIVSLGKMPNADGAALGERVIKKILR